MVFEAAMMARKGVDKEEIINQVNSLIPHTHEIAILKSLDYLRKGGRISIAKYLIGNLANFKPIIGVEDGLVKNIGRVKGFDNGIEILKKNILNILQNRKTDFETVFML
ncbi:MAG: DegV family protein [Candidatus Heimdallarchaeota archaeon]